LFYFSFGNLYFFSGAGGGGFGGAGEAGAGAGLAGFGGVPGGAGGPANGDLFSLLQGGTDGAPNGNPLHGGGGLELGAVGTLTLTPTATIYAAGETPLMSISDAGSGGGSGGGVILFGQHVTLQGHIDASGGAGGPSSGLPRGGVSQGGRGGGGRVLIEAYDTPTFDPSLISVAGGVFGSSGVISTATIPEPTSLVLAAIACAAGLACRGVRRGRAA
jgi:hypothetical protein